MGRVILTPIRMTNNQKSKHPEYDYVWFPGREDTDHVPQSHCCGSKLPLHDIVPTGHFTRIASAQSFYLNFGSQTDIIPPSRILDLSLAGRKQKQRSRKSMEVSLTWTAPGGDWNYGSASEYLLACSPDTDTLVSLLSDNSTMCELQPGEYGTQESCQVSFNS